MISWTSIPFRIGGKKNIVALGVPIAVWIIILIFWGVWWFVISLILVGGSILPYFLPTKYILSEDGISVRSPFTRQKKKWKDYRSYYVDKHGVFLSPFTRPSRLENFRGIYLRFHKNRDEVVDFVKQMMVAKDER